MDNFSGSKWWFEKFKKRYSLPLNIKFEGEAAFADKFVAEKFLPQIAQIIEENGYVPDQGLMR